VHEEEQRAVALLRQGEIRGLEALVRLHQVRAVRTACGITGDRQTAEDVVADAFLTVYDRIGSYDQRRPFGPWFYRIVVNAALKAVQRQQRVVPLVPETAAARDLEETVLRSEAQAAVRGALAGLSAEQRATVVLRYYLEMSEADIADTMGCALGTVKWRLHAAKARMQRGLEESQHA
jgi:RNA polymerase sigma-70 factor (ECF subfamily)